MAIAAYAFTFGKPLDWGAGGPAAWPESQPYHTPEGSQDQRGLRLPEWYAAISEASTGRSMPLIVVGGGAVPPRTAGEPGAAFEQNAGVARWLLGDEAPPSLLAFAYFLLTANPTDAEAHAAWYGAPDNPRGEVELVRRAVAAAAKLHRPKSIAHYILLPAGEASPLAWSLAGKLAQRGAGTVGFSPAEARLASRVTLLSSDEAFDPQLAVDLERPGSRVDRPIRPHLTNDAGTE
jgi:hypothetical protein